MSEVKIEGGYAKPTWRDLVIVKTFMLPYSALQYAKVYHRRYISSAVSNKVVVFCFLDVCRNRVVYGVCYVACEPDVAVVSPMN